VTRKPRVVTFRMDQATWDRMRELVPYTKYRNTSSFIREGIELMPSVGNGTHNTHFLRVVCRSP
jgi:Arc/MetJ-type ribon-helix-helix transcriptional regulator